ncbi:MAG: NusG domain II-containing protein [candidate division KSB1 bacterium]|nr:NusG domain II-containing protein [candidate division KSB1 bacterium]MDZ7294395.1 NusG domain II-containing protein [candidate division KSB1 bacterium]MDZ7386364.1 NusG domain II-containing protein [candidate division KSB1 bacterium]MDZ7393995.1 NusG domain II-containing protein [candidate division KSB1 bacterium]MDZ7414081.1 NusG domain II-containing protein [candidate division KSB1 bacterium]
MRTPGNHPGIDSRAKGIWRFLTPADRLLLGALLALSALSFAAVNQMRSAGETVVVQAGNREFYRGPLRQEQRLVVDGPVGTTIVEVHDGAAWVSASDCPMHLCVRMGKISRAGEVVVCIPNRVVVRIEGRRRNPLDAIIG